MGYLVQKTRAAQLLIGGQDYTSSLVSFQVSDSGAFKKGLMTTSGTLVLGQRPGGTEIENYDRNIFKRGTLITLDVTEPGGASYRHPRGHLYVISTIYSVEAEQLEVEIGCQLSLAYLTDNPEAILPLVPIHLDPAQQTVENCSASFASAGMVLYQNNQGSLVSRKFFDGDSSSGVSAGEWVSVLGESALAVSPLASGGAVPDRIELSYQVPESVLADDNLGKVDTTIETSQYFINYPATIWKRNPDPQPTGTITVPYRVVPRPSSPSSTVSCGNAPSPPTNSGGSDIQYRTTNFFLCNDLWTTDRANEYLPATRVSTSSTTYGAPGAQTSYRVQTVEGPEIEANSSYFADWYAFCVATYGSSCNPQGNCEYYGMGTQVLSKQETFYEYGVEANELVRTVQDTYQTILSTYTQADYRSGVVNGIPQNFQQGLSAADGMYRQSRVITEYSQEGNSNIQLTTTYTSLTSRGVGPNSGASLDALDGIKTSVRRESTTTTTLDVRPDTVNTATTSTAELSTELILNTNSYITPPSEAADYILEEAVPIPLLSENQAEIDAWVADYSEYLARFVKGDLYGLQIAESMRSEIVANWYPGMPFRYADTANNKISAMRMDACTWGVTQDEAIVVTNGIWLGFSSGALNLGSNLVGNSRPDMSGDTPVPPTGPTLPPTIDNDLVGQSFEFIVNVELNLSSSVFTYTESGVIKPNPTDLSALVEQAIVPYCTGFVVATGGLLDVDGTGSIPVEYNGSIVTEAATVVDADLFAAA